MLALCPAARAGTRRPRVRAVRPAPMITPRPPPRAGTPTPGQAPRWHRQAQLSARPRRRRKAGQRATGEAKPPSAPAGGATPEGRPSATLFQPTISATPGSPPDPVTGKTVGPGTQREAPSTAEGAGGRRAPEAGSGTGAGQTGPAPAAARDGDQRRATEQSGADRSGPAPPPDGNAFVIVPGVARYHRTGCILIRFLGGDNLETSTAQEAEAKGCAPCRACEPDKPLSSGD